VTSDCTRCDLCVDACPVSAPNPFDVGLGTLHAIDTPFAQAAPGAYFVDSSLCLNEPPNYIPCNRCVEVCEPDCITFDEPLVTEHERQFGAIVVATGFSLLDPSVLPEFGYGAHPDVLTALEYERLLSTNGPTEGELVRPSDRKHPQSLLFVLCVGSRDQRACHYCSRICCMYSMKEALQAVEHGVPEVTALYMDLRAYGKGFDEFLGRAEENGVRLVRGRPARVAPNGDGLEVLYEDTVRGLRVTENYDMVVLAPAIIPSPGTDALAATLGVDLDEDGFIRTLDPDKVRTSREGIVAAGCASGPRDIPDSVSQASAAAATAMCFVTERSWPAPPELEAVDPSAEARIGVFLCHCGANVAGVLEMEDLLQYARSLPGVHYAVRQAFSCAGTGVEEIAAAIRDEGLNRIVMAACSPKTHGDTFKRACERSGLNPYLMSMANLRNLNTWVHRDQPEEANDKAREMVAMAVAKARCLTPLEPVRQEMKQAALVIGGGVAGMAAAANLASRGFPAHLVERSDQLGGLVTQLEHLAVEGTSGKGVVAELERRVEAAGVNVYLGAEGETIDGHVGNYRARLNDGKQLHVGTLILAMGADPYRPQGLGYGENGNVVTNLEFEKQADTIHDQAVTLVGCVGSRFDGKGCSRYCCQTMVAQALRLRQQGNRVRVVSKDIRTYTQQGEQLYEEASRAGVQFFRYASDESAEEALVFEDGALTVHDLHSGRDLSLPTDLLVLQVGLTPPDLSLAQQLAVSRSGDGFLMERHPKLGPDESTVRGIYLAGNVQAPKTIDEAITQGLAAASKAGILLAHDSVESEPFAAVLDPDACIGCWRCEPVCPFAAIVKHEDQKVVEIVQAACMGCGGCASECPTTAIEMPYFTDDQLFAQIDAALAEEPIGKAIVFACNWCSYPGADLAGIAKHQYPPSCRIIRTMCSVRLSLDHILHAFKAGAGVVAVTGCHMGDCHYNFANENTEKRFAFWQKKVERKGIAAERLQLAWISAAEGKRFADAMKRYDEIAQRALQSGAAAGPETREATP